MKARLVSVNVGQVEPLVVGRRTVLTGIFKRPCEGPLHVGKLGLGTDHQADPRHHGGPDKAINVYPVEHLALWSGELQRSLAPGDFGENFTSEGLDETAVAIGDTFQIGDARFEVTQPRQPCGKLAARHGLPQFVRMVERSGRTGFYLRCLEPGQVEAGQPIERIGRPDDPVSIAEANRVLYAGKDAPRELLARLLDQPALSTAWRETLEGRV